MPGTNHAGSVFRQSAMRVHKFEFLEWMDCVSHVADVIALIGPFATVAGCRCWRVFSVEDAMRSHLIQRQFTPSDPKIEEGVRDTRLLRKFAARGG